MPLGDDFFAFLRTHGRLPPTSLEDVMGSEATHAPINESKTNVDDMSVDDMKALITQLQMTNLKLANELETAKLNVLQ